MINCHTSDLLDKYTAFVSTDPASITSHLVKKVLTGPCQCAYRSLLRFLREVVGLKNAVPGVVMAIHTIGEYPYGQNIIFGGKPIMERINR